VDHGLKAELDAAVAHLDAVADRFWTSMATTAAITNLTAWYQMKRDQEFWSDALAAKMQQSLADKDAALAVCRAENDHYRARVLTLERNLADARSAHEAFRDEITKALETY
jgi:hypothetical protein